MITSAKVSLSSVKAFEQRVKDANNYTEKFEQGFFCLDELYNDISALTLRLTGVTEEISSAREKLSRKIQNQQETIAEIASDIESLSDKKSSLENDLLCTEEYISVNVGEGETQDISNPVYTSIADEISELETEIEDHRTELYSCQQKLDHANSVDSHLISNLDAMESVIYSLEEKKAACKQLRTELENVKETNRNNCNEAVEKLQKIEQIIAKYLTVKMEYENVTSQRMTSSYASTGGVNINISINHTTVESGNHERESTLVSGYTKKQIADHHIKFDDENHVCEYDGRRYGGVYNSYQERLGRALQDDSIWGCYDGEPGESKFIPSGRTVEGLAVIEVLDKYDLDGIVYRNAEPEFEVCAEMVLTIEHMTENRLDYYDSDGNRMLGNYSQADEECARLWSVQNKDGKEIWTRRDVAEFRRKYNLSWHEKCDTKTMVLVPFAVNDYFKHIGGCSECRKRDAREDQWGEFDE